MPSASSEEQFKFLISCVRWSISGKVDFGEVAKECHIVSKGAAAKRYERMMKAHGISTNPASVRTGCSSRMAKTEQKGNPSSKKRKMDSFKDENGAGEDDPEQFEDVKTEQGNDEEEFIVKEEQGFEQGPISANDGSAQMSFRPHPDMGFLPGPGIFERHSSYNMAVNNESVYGLGNQQPRSHPSFFEYSGYEPANSVGEPAATPSAQHEPILINDSD